MTCAVVNVDADSVIQRTMYYASGVPMATSSGRDQQPYLYNGKEFVEAHGWNTYDYGFRGYYAPIGRFTSMDPLAESTPWQSPYAYANNNFINAIDWMGLWGMMSFSTPSCIVTDLMGRIIGGADDGDETIYIDLDGNWKPEDGKKDLIYAALMEQSFEWYMSAGGGGGIGGTVLSMGQVLNALICASMNGRLSISISVSVGLQAGDSFFSKGETNIGLVGNLMSLEIGSITLTNSLDDWLTDYSFIGKNNRITVQQGCQIVVPTYEKSFEVYASDLEYVPRTYQTNFNMTRLPYKSSEGDIHWKNSFGLFIMLTVEIIYRNPNQNDNE